jgi:amino acid transporter
VGLNYASICKYFPDGGGVYSAARSQGRLLAVVGALLLVADLTVTAALSCWEGLAYLGLSQSYIPYAAVAVIVVLGFLNSYGPKHSGSLAVLLAVPTVLVVIYLLGMAARISRRRTWKLRTIRSAISGLALLASSSH